MSGAYRQILGPTNARLINYLTEVKDLKTTPTDGTSHDEMIGELIDIIATIEHNIGRLTKSVTLIDDTNTKWLELIAKCSADRAKIEESIYEETSSKANNFLETMNSAREAIDVLESKRREITRQLQRMQKVGVETEDSHTTADRDHGTQMTARLPKIELEKFQGDVLHFTEFWESFSAAVHNQPRLATVDKFAYLMTYLGGRARAAVAGYARTEANYPIVIEVLKRRFGQKDLILHSLHTKLKNLPVATEKVGELRKTLESIELVCRQLEELDEDLNHSQVSMLIESKFPRSVLMEVCKARQSTDEWDTAALRNELEQIISLREEVGRIYSENIESGEHPQRRDDSHSDRNRQQHTDNSATSFSVIDDVGSETGSRGQGNSRGRGRGSQAKSETGNRGGGPRKQGEPICLFCKEAHRSIYCTDYPSIIGRKKRLNDLQRCHHCLSRDHSHQHCDNKLFCERCKQEHLFVLCPYNEMRTERQQDTPKRGGPPSRPQHTRGHNRQPTTTKRTRDSTNAHAVIQDEEPEGESDNYDEVVEEQHVMTAIETELKTPSHTEVLLMTTKMTVFNEKNPIVTEEVTVFFDGGSQKSFINKDLAERLQIDPIKTGEMSLATFGNKRSKTISTSTLKLGVRRKDGATQSVFVNTVENVTKYIKQIRIEESDLRSLQQEDNNFFKEKIESVKPAVLIGLDQQFQFFNPCVYETLPSGFKVLHSTVGPIICGPGNLEDTNDSVVSASVIVEPTIEKYWSLEEIGIKDCPLEKDDEVAAQQFHDTIKRDEEGRYQIKFPIKCPNPNLPTNYELCKGRLASVQKRLQQNPVMLDKYHNDIMNCLNKGILERSPTTTNHHIHYLAHHPVYTPDKTTTKQRIVFDASARLRPSLSSLNDVLYRGPVLLSELCGMLLRFRTGYIAILADVEKAFHQIGVQESDRDLTRILWLINPHKPPTKSNLLDLRFRRVPFGLNCSPYLLAGTIQAHLKIYGDDLANEIARNIYVDNVLLIANDHTEATHKYRRSKEIFATAKMNLREFTSNDQKLNNLARSEGSGQEKAQVKFLGIQWNTETDMLTISLPAVYPSTRTEFTKRDVASIIASVFDPLGLIAPVIVTAKVFFQRLWKQSYKWDDKLHQDDCEAWTKLMEEWTGTKFLIPRRHSGITNARAKFEFELHTFVDASASAYAAVTYLKAVPLLRSMDAEVDLIMSKNRLCPTTAVTIPRLELMALLIGTRLTAYVKRELAPLQISKTFLWTDSQCNLHLISTTKEQQRFVKNRLDEIKGHLDFQFRFVPTKSNPADLSSRGVTGQDFQNMTLWWKGPIWLKLKPENWPTTPEIPTAVTTLPEISNVPDEETTIATSIASCIEPTIPFVDTTRFSTWLKLLTTVAFVLRFIKLYVFDKLKSVPKNAHFISTITSSNILNANDYRIAEIVLLRLTTTQHSPTLQEQKLLNLYQDEHGLWHCGGRLDKSTLPPTAIHPIHLPRKSHITQLIILHYHITNGHSGIAHTLSQIRQRFWILKARSTVKRVINSLCFMCRKFLATPFVLPPMPPLPALRITRTMPFQNTGLDYLGPTFVRENGHKVKKWICLLTCLVTRAIHLEPVGDLTSVTFLHAIRRFIARRGRPHHIISDNASTFRLTAKAIDDAWNSVITDETVRTYIAQNRMSWHFISPLSPWKGGFYERLVALVKTAFRRTVGRNCLNSEQFVTLTYEIEAILNTRPLTFIYDDIKSFEILRPSDFLQVNFPGTPILHADDDSDNDYHPPNISSREKILDSWKHSQRKIDDCWKYFLSEYLPSLREKHQILHKGPRSQYQFVPTVGELVLLEEENLQRGSWKLARIVALQASQDNEIRTATIELANGKELVRPISLLYPLECRPEGKRSQQPTVNVLSVDGSNSQSAKATKSAKLSSIYFLASILLLTFVNHTMATQCSMFQDLERIHTQTCVRDGVVVMKRRSGNLCWIHITCDKGQHIKPIAFYEQRAKLFYNQSLSFLYCGQPCKCPTWASSCSHYSGPATISSTITNEDTRNIIEGERPIICSFEPSPQCSGTASLGRFSQISLYDNSTHLVKSLQLVQVQVLVDDYECVGHGIQTGSSKFCENHPCEPAGTKFCYYSHNTIVQLATDSGNIIIAAWGTVQKRYYAGLPPVKFVNCNDCRLRCQQGGVQIILSMNIDQIEVCTRGHCYHQQSPSSLDIIYFHADVSLYAHEITYKMWSTGQLVTDSSINCPADPFCTLIKCTFCYQYFANPQCAPQGTVLLVVLTLYSLSTTLYMAYKFCTTIKTLICGLFRINFKVIRTVITYLAIPLYAITNRIRKLFSRNSTRKSSHEKQSDPLIEVKTSGSWTFQPRRRSIFTATLLILCYFTIHPTEGCSDTTILTASHDVCSLNNLGLLSCRFSATTLLSLLPEGQQACLLLRNNRNQIIGSLSIEIKEIYTLCKAKSEYFTREYEISVESAKRCPQAGSCVKENCANTTLETKYPEFSEEANRSPGFSYCVESCGCWACDCFLCTSGCLFYRIFAKPTSQRIFEVVTCPIWELQVRFNVQFQINNESLEHQFTIGPGKSHRWHNIKFTTTTITAPSTPILGSIFLTDMELNRTVLLRPFAESLQSTGINSFMQFSTIERARNFDGKFPPEICACRPAEIRINCNCNEMSLENLFNDKERLLPLATNGLFITATGHVIKSVYEYTAAIQVQLTLDDLTISSKVNSNLCTISTTGELSGCYLCVTGATLNVSCSTDFGHALAQISCKNTNTTFAVPCDAGGISSTVTLSFSYSLVNETCEASCPAGTNEFNVHGILFFMESQILRNASTKSANSSYNPTEGQLLVNWSILKNILAFNIYNTLTILITIGIIACLAYLVFPFVLKYFLMKKLMFSERKTR